MILQYFFVMSFVLNYSRAMMLIVMMFGSQSLASSLFFRLADKDRGKCFGGVARLVTAVTNHALIICRSNSNDNENENDKDTCRGGGRRKVEKTCSG